ncbi:hypothetical protein CEP88_17255 [Roseobacter denitrificans]|uniref:Uncharacterized protein n=1 Tax=Roseobacter denitrificans (strain ATCC 33942 / OCh 114) TaxID=375451 RepID=Q16A92_ROSDO|nr:hypothetical protein [Roseobacter denitrificans]ABG31101.1 hypothetical protein RD1_1467 [Roseobacter denitrificans OCh 114]AVL54173.1 hypothetical protein CEP88_17255 [Roseobacter denitrificans]SFG32857.1 hypothetical protein SAMN05443635_11370 [Roseobacter denitrificans OCh 114]
MKDLQNILDQISSQDKASLLAALDNAGFQADDSDAMRKEKLLQLISDFRSLAGRCGVSHVQWLADWHKARDAAAEASDDTPEETEHMDTAEALSILLASTPATSPENLIAQIAWFKEDLGDFVLGNTLPDHDMIFEASSKGVANIKK